MVRTALLLPLLAAAAMADDARAVLEDIATNARSVSSWKVIGRIVSTLAVQNERSTLDMAFNAASERPRRVRYEIAGGRNAGLMVCDSADTKPACPASATNWETLTDSLSHASFSGSDTALFEGRDQPCTIIVATYRALPGLLPGSPNEVSTGAFTRTLCVERVRRLVLRDDVTGAIIGGPRGLMRIAQTTTYSVIERDPKLNADVFRKAPLLPRPDGGEPLARPIPPAGHTAPELVLRKQAEFTDEARAANYQGTAVLRILIGADGVPRDPRIVSAAGYGLDVKALEAVSEWRFRPATRHGRTIAQAATVEMSFRRLE